MLTAGTTVSGLARTGAWRSFGGPQRGRWRRAATMASSSPRLTARGLMWGRRDWSTNGAQARARVSYVSPVFRLIPRRRHASLRLCSPRT
ncbi:MAG TPA: hypothetical protein VF406_06995 [Thermodesulfobacteriota bacterium]